MQSGGVEEVVEARALQASKCPGFDTPPARPHLVSVHAMLSANMVLTQCMLPARPHAHELSCKHPRSHASEHVAVVAFLGVCF